MKQNVLSLFTTNNLYKSLQIFFVFSLFASSSTALRAQTFYADWTTRSWFSHNFILPGDRIGNTFPLDPNLNDLAGGPVCNVNTNWITNGTFDTDISGWTATGNVAWFAPDSARFNGGNTAPNGVLSQTIQTIPNRTYRITYTIGRA